MTIAGPVTFSMRPFLIHSSPWKVGSMVTALGTFTKRGRMSVSPAARSRIGVWCCCRCPSRPCATARAGEEDHVLFLRLVGVARRVRGKHEHWPRGTEPDHSNSSPHINSCRQPVTTRGNKDNAFPGGFLHLVDSELQCLSVVVSTVGVHREI